MKKTVITIILLLVLVVVIEIIVPSFSRSDYPALQVTFEDTATEAEELALIQQYQADILESIGPHQYLLAFKQKSVKKLSPILSELLDNSLVHEALFSMVSAEKGGYKKRSFGGIEY